MRERDLRALVDRAVDKFGERLPPIVRRQIQHLAAVHDLDVFVCDGCGLARDEALCMVSIRRRTRRQLFAIVTLCHACRTRVPHDAIVR